MNAIVDQDTCISCGLCVNTCPEVYSFDDDGKAQASEENIPDDALITAMDARDGCPVNAIDIKE